jgi:hypothetical protein
MLDRRVSKREEADLINQLESKAKLLNRFLGAKDKYENPTLRNLKTDQDYERLKEIFKAVEADIAKARDLVDQGIKDLESYGMKEHKYSEATNIFYNPEQGANHVDKAVLLAEEHFGDVIIKGHYLKMGKGEAIFGGERSQARDAAIQAYKEATKKQVNLIHEVKFLHNIIDLAYGHSTSVFKAQEALLALRTKPVSKDEKPEHDLRISSNLREILIALTQTVDSVREITRYNHLMTAKEFQSKTSIFYYPRPSMLKKIDSMLAQLEDPAPRNSQWISFWKNPTPTPVNPEGRANQLLELRNAVTNAIDNKKIHIARKDGLKKLLIQVDYQIQRNNSENKRQQKKLASEPVQPAARL